MILWRGEVVLMLLLPLCALSEDDNERVKTPSLCEVCKFLTVELKNRLHETGKSKEVLQTGQGLDSKRKIKYQTSELRLIEALQEPHVCEKILEYNIHAEKEGSKRYAKGRSETMETLHGLVAKGVKVELGMPYEMWDKPSAEVTHMQRKCFSIVEDYEDDIEAWYYHHQDHDLTQYLCEERVLQKADAGCLNEAVEARSGSKASKGDLKGDTGSADDLSNEIPVVNDDNHDEL
ncbi:protein canopy 4-like [Haliotis cracherodii]|uniref:protein canopy 4-like n=1 Tax=Haliotis cracherodii TaxID=6455 RepID=UPI0039EC53F0